MKVESSIESSIRTENRNKYKSNTKLPLYDGYDGEQIIKSSITTIRTTKDSHNRARTCPVMHIAQHISDAITQWTIKGNQKQTN